jgi:hypothetical protein
MLVGAVTSLLTNAEDWPTPVHSGHAQGITIVHGPPSARRLLGSRPPQFPHQPHHQKPLLTLLAHCEYWRLATS